jgi:hypothetical protein
LKTANAVEKILSIRKWFPTRIENKMLTIKKINSFKGKGRIKAPFSKSMIPPNTMGTRTAKKTVLSSLVIFS